MFSRRLLFCALVLGLAGTLHAADAVLFRIVPEQVELDGNFSQAQLVVTASDASGSSDAHSGDLTRQAKYIAADAKIATIDAQGRILPVADGATKIRVTHGGTTREVNVTVRNVTAEPVVSFTEHIMPIFSKAGCNQAACHAAQHGKGGFKLSVFGYAPDEDYAMIARERQGRRINQLSPDQSLVLRKPTMGVSHVGGKRLDRNSLDYQILRGWIAGGAVPPKKDDPLVQRIRVYPQERWGAVGMEQQLRVVAEYADGKTKDITPWAKFDSMDDAVLTISPTGYFRTVGRGQAPVMVRFEGQAEVCMVMVPYSQGVEIADWKNNNFIDELALKKFHALGIAPSPLCDDATFLRRAYLDVTGSTPTVEQARAFLNSKSSNKRAELIDELLGLTGDPARDIHNNAYAAYWTNKWADLIRNSSANLGRSEQGMWAMHNWIKESLRTNKPFDQFVEELITARGSIFRSGPANFFRIANNPLDLAETTAQLFLGVRLQCAKCHHHPLEKYSQDDYYGFAAYFARVGTKGSSEFGLFGGEQVVMVRNTGDVRHVKTNVTMKPTPLDGEPTEAESADRRVDLAKWLTRKDNAFFAHNIANRYFAYLMGRGLVEPVDDMRATNPATNEPLLDRLSADFVEHNYDVKHLLKTIMNSRLYQLSSQPTKENVGDSKFYTYYRVKRMGAEPLLDAIDQATGAQTKFNNLPLGTRAIELPDTNYPDYFLATFGKPRRVSVCECERVADENLAQALHTLNGDILANKIGDKAGRLAKLLDRKATDAEIVEELYLATLARKPSEKEAAACQEWLKQAPDRRQFYEDLLWSLVNSKQFLFVH